MSRRPTGRSRRFPARRVASGPAPFTPSDDPLALLWWDPTSVSGAVSSWVDVIAGVSAAQGTASLRPTASATAIGGAYPGVTGDAGDVLVAAGAGAVLSGKTTLTVVAAMVDSDTAVKVALELTTNATTTNGGLFVVVNDGAAGRLNVACRGASDYTQGYVSEALASVKVVSVGYDFATAGAGAVSFVRVNGAAQSVTAQRSLSAAGLAANASLHLFGRGATPTLGWAGSFGHIVFRESIAQDAGLAALETYVGARVGITI